MLTAEQVTDIVNLTPEGLTTLIQARHPKDSFLTAKLLGLNNNSQFVFSATFYSPLTERVETTKVLVGRMNGLIVAAY